MLRVQILLVALLMAGCSQPPADADDAETKSTTSDAIPGMVLEAVLNGGASQHNLNATLRNDANVDYWTWSGCGGPWTFQLTDAEGRTVEPRGPTAQCLGHGHHRLGPGDAIWVEDQWSHMEWNASQEALVTAPPGQYAWRVKVYPIGDDESLADPVHSLELAFDIRITADA